MALPRILIGTPTYDGKNYCLKEFIDNVKRISYPRNLIDFVIFDNSLSNENALYINKTFGIKCQWKNYDGYTVFERMADTHERIRRYAIDKEFDYLLHLESDVFPEPDALLRLLWTKKNVVSALYMIGTGGRRHPVTRVISRGGLFNNRYASGIELGNYWHHYVDGTVKECLTSGIGCILLRRDVFMNVEFRYEQGADMAPDSFFTNDLYQMDIRNYVHTGVVAFHWNEADWGHHSHLLTESKTV